MLLDLERQKIANLEETYKRFDGWFTYDVTLKGDPAPENLVKSIKYSGES